MDELYHDTRNKKGQKYSNCVKGKKGKSLKSEMMYKKLTQKYIRKAKGGFLTHIITIPPELEKHDPKGQPWYKIRHHGHCFKCNPKYSKENNIKRQKDRNIKVKIRKKHFNENDFDFTIH